MSPPIVRLHGKDKEGAKNTPRKEKTNLTDRASAVYLMSTWYTREELSKRYALFYLGPALANMFGGLIAAGVLQGLDGHGGLRAWRWLYVVEGVCTVGLSLVSL